MNQLKFKRVLIKLSGELVFKNKNNTSEIKNILCDIKRALNEGAKIAIVIGGGNIIRGSKENLENRITRNTADNMGMLATMINALALSDMLKYSFKIENKILASKKIDGIFEASNYKIAENYLKNGQLIIFAGGTGNPFMSTDSAATLRAIEINAEAILKITKVNGVYNKDPLKYENTFKFKKLNFIQVLEKKLEVMDLNAFIQAKDFNIPICVFNAKKPKSVLQTLYDQSEGTWIKNWEIF